MEVFSGGRRMLNDDVGFPEHLTPFPEATDLLFDHRAAIRPPEVERHSQLPPQKLRPIRCHGRSLPECSDHTGSESAGLEGTLMSCQGDLGFLTQLSPSPQKLSLVNGGLEECSNTPPELGSGSLPDNGGSGVPGNPCLQEYVPEMEQIMLEMNAECVNLISEACLFEAELRHGNASGGDASGVKARSGSVLCKFCGVILEQFRESVKKVHPRSSVLKPTDIILLYFSSSSDDDAVSSEAMTEPLTRKRKRRTRKTLKLFLENMMRKVIQKQEQMHKQLIEMIDRKENERIIREEAWKQQEIERAKKHEEVRAQERARSLALISFIQNLLGQEIQVPKSLEASCLETDAGELTNQKDNGYDPCNKRWPKSEVQALITIRTALEHKFLKGPKGSVWEEVAAGLTNMGYSRSAKKCKEKWENINKYYKRTMENGKKRADSGKTCPYFQELDILYKSGLINPGNAASQCIKSEIEEKSLEE